MQFFGNSKLIGVVPNIFGPSSDWLFLFCYRAMREDVLCLRGQLCSDPWRPCRVPVPHRVSLHVHTCVWHGRSHLH